MDQTAWRLAETDPKNLATPLKWEQDTWHALPHLGYPDWPAGLLRASTADMSRFLAACANGGRMGTTQILAPKSMARMTTFAQIEGLPQWSQGQGLAWYQVRLDGQLLACHLGGDSGTFSAAYFDPATHTGVVILSNVSSSAARMKAFKAIASHVLQSLIVKN